MIAACTGNEVLIPKVFTPKERSDAEVKGINESMLLQFIDDVLAQAVEGLDRYPMYLILDKSTIHQPAKIIQAFQDRSSYSISNVLLLPTQAAKRLSPLDNSLFHTWKERVRVHCPLTLESIQQVMVDEWNRITKREIRAQYKHCKMMTNQDEYEDCPEPSQHCHTTAE